MQDRIAILRSKIESAYIDHPTGCGCSFDELLCWEIHCNNKTFRELAEKWGISLPTLGELIYEHCKALEALPHIVHE